MLYFKELQFGCYHQLERRQQWKFDWLHHWLVFKCFDDRLNFFWTTTTPVRQQTPPGAWDRKNYISYGELCYAYWFRLAILTVFYVFPISICPCVQMRYVKNLWFRCNYQQESRQQWIIASLQNWFVSKSFEERLNWPWARTTPVSQQTLPVMWDKIELHFVFGS